MMRGQQLFLLFSGENEGIMMIYCGGKNQNTCKNITIQDILRSLRGAWIRNKYTTPFIIIVNTSVSRYNKQV